MNHIKKNTEENRTAREEMGTRGVRWKEEKVQLLEKIEKFERKIKIIEKYNKKFNIVLKGVEFEEYNKELAAANFLKDKLGVNTHVGK